MTISLAMIVKNEAQTIERTIESVRDFVDEIVIGMDTDADCETGRWVYKLASTVILTRLSEELHKKGPVNGGTDWGFSHARNQVLDRCKPGNWRLILDGHETIPNPELLAEVVETAKKENCDGVEVQINFEPGPDGIPQTTFGGVRLLAPSVRYANPIHNVPVVKSSYMNKHIKVEHRKSDQKPSDKLARDKQRTDSNIKGLEQNTQDDPNSSRAWFYLGTTYKENVRYSDAVDAFQKCLDVSVWNEERWQARYNMGVCYRMLLAPDKAREQFSLAIEEYPTMAEAHFQLGDIAYHQGKYREAKLWLEECIQMPVPHCRLFMDTRIYLVTRFDILSMVYHHLGHYQEAITMAHLALKEADNARIQKNIDLWQKHIDDKDPLPQA